MTQMSPLQTLKSKLIKVMNFEKANAGILNYYNKNQQIKGPKYVDLYTFKYKTLIIAVLLIIANNLLKKFAGWYISDLYIFTVPLFIATAYGTYRTLKTLKKDIAKVVKEKEVLKEYKEMIDDFNAYSEACSHLDVYRWWEKYDRLAELSRNHVNNGILTWYPLEKYYFDEEDGVYRIRKSKTCNEGTLSGESVKEIFFENEQLDLLYDDIENDGIYKFGVAYLSDFHHGHIYTTSETASYSDVKNQINEYGNKLDNEERFFNMINGAGSVTDRTRYVFRDMSSNDYLTSSAIRSVREYNKSQKIRNQTNNRVVEENNYEFLERVGIIIFDEKEEVVKSVLIYKDPAEREYIEYEKYDGSLADIDKFRKTEHFDLYRKDAIYQIGGLLNYDKYINVIADKRKSFSDVEWGLWLYNRF